MPQDNFFTSSFGAPEIIVALSLGLFIVWTCRLSTKRHRYPPGPPGNILVGNILEVPSSGAWYKLTENKNVYGMTFNYRSKARSNELLSRGPRLLSRTGEPHTGPELAPGHYAAL